MPYSPQQTQAFCHACQRNTLHTRNLREVNHFAYVVSVLLLLIASLCVPLLFAGLVLTFWGIAGIVVLVWFLDGILVVVPLNQPPFRCTQCGQQVGALTPAQLAARRQAEAESKAAAAAQRAERKRRYMLMREEKRRARRRARAQGKTAAGVASRVLGKTAEGYTKISRLAAGRDNTIVSSFLMVAIPVVIVIALSCLVWVIL